MNNFSVGVLGIAIGLCASCLTARGFLVLCSVVVCMIMMFSICVLNCGFVSLMILVWIGHCGLLSLRLLFDWFVWFGYLGFV